MSTPTEQTQPGKGRLVPDHSANIEVDGQRLTRVKRLAPEETKPGTPASLEDVVKKHLGVGARALEENADILRDVSGDEPPEDARPAQSVASRVELYTTDAPVPPADPDPHKREGVSMSSLVAVDDDALNFISGKEPPETLLDLFSMFPLDGVSWFILVERKAPKVWYGQNVGGTMRKLTRPISLDEWQEIYGGGTYKLTVYGPAKRGLVMQGDGRYLSKKMTEPITVVFPGRPSLICMEDLEDEERMTQSLPEALSPRRGPMTPADANVEVKRIETAAEREKRQESTAEREREKNERLVKEKAAQDNVLLSKIMEMHDKASAREAELRQQMLDREREVADQRRLDDEKWEERIRKLTGETKKPDDVERLVTLASAINKPDGSIDALREQHARELTNMQRAVQEDAARSSTILKDERERADRRIAESEARAVERIRDIEGRAAERVKETEKRFGDLEREIRERADREVQRAKEDGERRVGDMHRQHVDAMTAETRNHARDIESLKAQHAMAMESQKGTYEMRLETARGEVKRTASDVERYREEAESNKDVVGKITKLKEEASALGMIDASEAGGSEPETTGQMLLKMGAGLLGNLPGMVENLTALAKGRSPAEQMAARDAAQREMIDATGHAPVQQLPPQHRRRAPQLNPGELRHMSEVPPPPPRRQGVEPVVVQAPPSAFRPMHEPERAPPPPQQPSVEFPPPPPAPHASSPPPPMHQPASVPPPALAVSGEQALLEDRQILEGEPILLQQYQAGVSPEAIAEHAYTQFGRETVQNLLTSFGSAERVILAVERSGDPGSPFVRRDGKKFLRALFSEFQKVMGRA